MVLILAITLHGAEAQSAVRGGDLAHNMSMGRVLFGGPPPREGGVRQPDDHAVRKIRSFTLDLNGQRVHGMSNISGHTMHVVERSND